MQSKKDAKLSRTIFSGFKYSLWARTGNWDANPWHSDTNGIGGIPPLETTSLANTFLMGAFEHVAEQGTGRTLTTDPLVHLQPAPSYWTSDMRTGRNLLIHKMSVRWMIRMEDGNFDNTNTSFRIGIFLSKGNYVSWNNTMRSGPQIWRVFTEPAEGRELTTLLRNVTHTKSIRMLWDETRSMHEGAHNSTEASQGVHGSMVTGEWYYSGPPLVVRFEDQVGSPFPNAKTTWGEPFLYLLNNSTEPSTGAATPQFEFQWRLTWTDR